MKKRFLSALLVLSAILFYSPMSVVAETGNEISAETGDPYLYEYKTPPDMYEEEYGVPDEVLALNTPDLLEAFLQSGRLQGLYWVASTEVAFESSLRWCSDYKELAELVCRTDFTSSESRSVEDIDYAYAAIYTTEGNKSTGLYTASRELTDDEKTAANNQNDKIRERVYMNPQQSIIVIPMPGTIPVL